MYVYIYIYFFYDRYHEYIIIIVIIITIIIIKNIVIYIYPIRPELVKGRVWSQSNTMTQLQDLHESKAWPVRGFPPFRVTCMLASVPERSADHWGYDKHHTIRFEDGI